MELYEAKAIMDYEYLVYKDGWEQARLIAYMIAQTNSTKKLELTDILKFHWEKAKDEVTTMSNAEMERLRQRAKQFESNFNTEYNGK